MRSALTDVADKWKPIGSVLGLTTAELNAIKAKNENNVDQCLNDMILKWFEKSSSANPATLRQLVGAIATQTGGKNPAHAGSVSERFQGEGVNCISAYYVKSAALLLYFCWSSYFSSFVCRRS